MHSTQYLTAANNAVAHERERHFSIAGQLWLVAYNHASPNNKEWCANRAFFCNKFGKIIEVDDGGHN